MSVRLMSLPLIDPFSCFAVPHSLQRMALILLNQVMQNLPGMRVQNIQMGSCLSILEPFLHYLQLHTKEESSEKLGCIHHR